MLRALAAAGVLLLAMGAAPPDPAASGDPIPEIGRTRATSPACAAMRDLVIPSFAAAQRADLRFVQTRKQLPNYGAIASDVWNKNSVDRDAALARLDTDVSVLLRESQVIQKALSDPRLAPGAKDPQVVAERAQLQTLYDVQRGRADMLNEFVTREHVKTAQNGMEGNGGVVSRTASFGKLDALPGKPLPDVTAPPGMPLLSGEHGMMDRKQLDDWGTSIAAIVRTKENEAAKAFLPIAKSCP